MYKREPEGKRCRKKGRASLSSQQCLHTRVHTTVFTPANQKQSLIDKRLPVLSLETAQQLRAHMLLFQRTESITTSGITQLPEGI